MCGVGVTLAYIVQMTPVLLAFSRREPATRLAPPSTFSMACLMRTLKYYSAYFAALPSH